MGMVDQLGSVRDAVAKAEELARLEGKARVVAYRKAQFANDNPYNPLVAIDPRGPAPLVDLGPAAGALSLPAGFYHLWLPEGS
jgi:protease-4